MTVEKNVISIHGVPRSGTSWLGQIFNSHPDVAYRHQPLFAHRFKNRLNLDSTQEEIEALLKELYNVTDDDFILDRRDAYGSLLPLFEKNEPLSFLVMKMVRYHHLIEKFINEVDGIKIIGIVRNPCAVINSWLQAPKEFNDEWEPVEEWRYASRKNLGRIEEYNGFEKWKEVARLFLHLEHEHPDTFRLIQYENLVSRPLVETNRLYDFCGLIVRDQVRKFIEASQRKHSEHAYAIFKRPSVKNRWKKELNPMIREAIINEIEGTILGRFLA